MDRYIEDKMKTFFFVLVCGDHDSQISPRANKNIIFWGPSPYYFASAQFFFATGELCTVNRRTFYVMSGQKNPALLHLPTYYSTSSLVQNRIAFFAF